MELCTAILKLLKKQKLALLFFAFTACNTQNGWKYQQVLCYSPSLNSKRISYLPKEELLGVGIELLKGQFGTIGYLSVTCRQIPPLPDDQEKAMVLFQIDEEKFSYKAKRMEGGQRLLLPEQATQQLISSLNIGKKVTIYLEGYMTQIDSNPGF